MDEEKINKARTQFIRDAEQLAEQAAALAKRIERFAKVRGTREAWCAVESAKSTDRHAFNTFAWLNRDEGLTPREL